MYTYMYKCTNIINFNRHMYMNFKCYYAATTMSACVHDNYKTYMYMYM